MPTKTTKTTKTPSKALKNTRATGNALATAIKAELSKPIIPGEVLLGAEEIEAFKGRETKELTVANTGDRPIQVGSHCHFFEVNRALIFDREQAYGFRLCIPAGTAVRFEPGEEKRVTLVALAGNRIARGINGLTEGPLGDPSTKAGALARAAERGFLRKGGGR
ncbi:MAG TPA: urease subunit beta [Nitrospiraceae bacterium]|jgi:urease beta subunit|nr:urease subunit beta [Nitrospiraceae bacterium]